VNYFVVNAPGAKQHVGMAHRAYQLNAKPLDVKPWGEQRRYLYVAVVAGAAGHMQGKQRFSKKFVFRYHSKIFT
jgi:hypothetical protein